MLRFIFGTIFGIFLEQNYDFPNIKNTIEDLKVIASRYEKPEEKQQEKLQKS